MYLPRHFEETRTEILHELMRAHPFATLVTLTADGLEANHIPFELDSEPGPFGTLLGHVGRANGVWREFSRDVEAMVIFHGPQNYVSPSWYPTKEETGMVVPTWNYAVVHARGPLRVIEDRRWLRELVERLTNKNESGRSNSWKVSDAPSDYIDRLLDAIVGLEMRITRLAGKWKVSQNRPVHDQNGAIEGLLQDGSESAVAMARLIRERQERSAR